MNWMSRINLRNLRSRRNLRDLRISRITSTISTMKISARITRNTPLKITPEAMTIAIQAIPPAIQVAPAIQVVPAMIYQSLHSHSHHHPPFLFPFQLNYHQLHPIINTNPFSIISMIKHHPSSLFPLQLSCQLHLINSNPPFLIISSKKSYYFSWISNIYSNLILFLQS